MWRLYTTAKATHSRPSALVCVEDRWAAYQFDSAVSFFGIAVENAAQEQIKAGEKWVNRYTLDQLLTPGFVLGDGEAGDALPFSAQAAPEGLVYDEIG
jgi:hypothetical protein